LSHGSSIRLKIPCAPHDAYMASTRRPMEETSSLVNLVSRRVNHEANPLAQRARRHRRGARSSR
jgi:hypothetical protein